MSRIETFESLVTLAALGAGDSLQVPCEGASRVAWSVKCNVTHQLTTCSVQTVMTDDKVITVVPAALPGGLDSTIAELNVAGGATASDLSGATHRGIILRPLLGNGTTGPYGFNAPIPNLKRAVLTMVKANTAGPAIYTVRATVYYP